MVILKPKQKKVEGHLKIKLCCKRLYPTEIVKYLGVQIDTNPSWQCYVNNLSTKLNRVNALLFKMREYVSLKILRSIYFVIFDFYLSESEHYSTNCDCEKKLEFLIFNQVFPMPVPNPNKT